jgi:GntR family phosphonate transport system transcriptional regulator
MARGWQRLMEKSGDGIRQAPRWRVIEETLEREVVDGRYRPDEPLPAETKIAERFQVSRMTARKALESLKTRGFLRIEHGRGSFVDPDVLAYRLGHRQTFVQSVLETGRVPSRALLQSQIEAPALWARRLLGLPSRARVLTVVLLAKADGRPMAISTNHLVLPRYRGFVEALGPEASVETAMAALGVEDRSENIVSLLARTPTSAEAKLLDIGTSRPVLEKEGIGLSGSGPIWCHKTVYAGDRVRLMFDPP